MFGPQYSVCGEGANFEAANVNEEATYPACVSTPQHFTSNNCFKLYASSHTQDAGRKRACHQPGRAGEHDAQCEGKETRTCPIP